jgi:ABC-2 type transport system ATP-binding protein
MRQMDSPEKPAIVSQNLTKRFRHVTALDALNLTIMPGDVFALLGANGSGKSTTFRLLLNIYRPTAGESALLGTPSKKLNGAAFDKVCYISEGQKMPKWMSVEQYLKYCGGFYSDWDAGLCARLVERFELPTKQKIKFLSRGQCMKVCLASTLPSHPKLLLLDEPFSGLDVETRAGLSELLKSLANESGLAILLTTHDVEEVEPVATRLGILSQGQLRVDEPIRSYMERHRLLNLVNFPLEQLPSHVRRHFGPIRSSQIAADAFTQSYGPELESLMAEHLPETAEAHFTPMTLRQILTAHSLRLK